VDSQYVVYEYSIDKTGPWQSVAFDGAVYARVRTNNNGTWSAWSVYRIKGETGSPGLPGADGDRGSSILSGTATSSSAMVNAFYNEFGNVVNGDQYLSSNSTTGSIIYTYNGSSFVNTTALKVDGDAIINGTLAVDKLVHLGTDFSTKRFAANGTLGGYQGGVLGWDPNTSGSYAGVIGASKNYGIAGLGFVGGTSTGGVFAYSSSTISSSYPNFKNQVELSTPSYAGVFTGDVTIKGNLTVSGSYPGGGTSSGVTTSTVQSMIDTSLAPYATDAEVVQYVSSNFVQKGVAQTARVTDLGGGRFSITFE
jgi:hypothetical protein